MTENHMSDSSDRDDQLHRRTGQGKVKTTVEFFREKFADEEMAPVWIDPKGDAADVSGGDE